MTLEDTTPRELVPVAVALMGWASAINDEDVDASSFCTGFEFGLELAFRRAEFARELREYMLAETRAYAERTGKPDDEDVVEEAFDALEELVRAVRP